MHRLPIFRLLLVGFIVAGAALFASLPAATAQGGDGSATISDSRFLPAITGEWVMVRYAPGSLDRAARLHTRLDQLYEYLDRYADVNSTATVYVLSEEHWENRDPGQPYGFPVRLSGNAAAVPAWGSPATVELWSRLLGTVPSNQDFLARGSESEAGSLVLADSFLALDLCRLHIESLGMFRGPDAQWLAEVATHIACLSARRSGQGPLLIEPAMLLSVVPGLEPPTRPGRDGLALDSYGPGVAMPTWLWYQAQAAVAADLVFQTHERRGWKRMVRAWEKKKAPLTWNDVASLTPTLVAWRRGEYRVGGAPGREPSR
ncbi:MAG: hypothetical protein AAGD01_20000 [Acidobacteriota bacterium]